MEAISCGIKDLGFAALLVVYFGLYCRSTLLEHAVNILPITKAVDEVAFAVSGMKSHGSLRFSQD